MKPVLVLDCDGVLYQLTEWVLANRVNPELGTNYQPDDVTTWKWSALPEQAARIFYRELALPDAWSQGDAYAGVADDVRELSRTYTIAIVTAMRPQYEALRARWLRDNDITHDHLWVTSSKLKAAQVLRAVAAVDDYPVTANKLGEHNIPTWLVNRPWNQFEPTGRNVERGSWSAGVKWLAKYGARS